MRNDDGVFVGNDICIHFQIVDRIEERVCCGGRRSKYAFVKCEKKGIVYAEGVCVSACTEAEYPRRIR